MKLSEWARKWNIPLDALIDLQDQLGVHTTPAVNSESEAAVQARIRLEASRKGLRLFRNNVGACMDDRGNYIRYGLANDSKKMNAEIKSSDLIGIRPVEITEDHVGMRIGQFVAREVKESNWVYKGTSHEQAQLKFIELIASLGGDAKFTNSEGSL